MSVCLVILNWSLNVGLERYSSLCSYCASSVGFKLRLGCLYVSLIWDNQAAIEIVDAQKAGR